MTIHRIKLKDLNEAFIKQLRKELTDEEAILTIWLPEKREKNFLTEESFWEIIAMLNWEGNETVEVINPVIEYLNELPIPAIEEFEDILSEKLFLLDGQKFAEHTGDNAYRGEKHPFSADEFLYARCYVVAQGKDFLLPSSRRTQKKCPKTWVSSHYYPLLPRPTRQKTGQGFSHIPAFIIETFANSDGWKNQGLIDKILS